MGKVREEKSRYDLLTAVMVCLGKEDTPSPTRALRLLNVLPDRETASEVKKQVMEEEFHLPMTDGLQSEVNMMCNLSQGVLEDGIRIGRAEGRAEGRDEGRAERGLEAVRAVAESLGVPYEKAMDILKITDQTERQRYLDQLKH